MYDVHTYHTKVPPQGIIPLIEHYTEPGAVVLDPFCGSGMTGVAATEAGRAVVLCDLSPAAAFIAYNNATPTPTARFMAAVRVLLAEGASLERYLYDTNVRGSDARVSILYTVWSYGMLCSACGKEFVLWDVARDERESVKESKILSEFDCPHCCAPLSKRGLTRTKRYPIQVGYANPYRRLYADWLQEAIQATEIRLGFADFRALVDESRLSLAAHAITTKLL